MDSDPLVEVYKKYKRGTTKIATWLVESATTLCVDIPKQRSPRPSSSTTPTKCTIGCADLLRITRDIVHAPSSQRIITRGIINTLEDVISARKMCAEWYSGLEDQDGAKSSESHAYFIGVLEQMLQLLRESLSTGGGLIATTAAKNTVRNGSGESTPATPPPLVNMFAHLQVEETSAIDTDSFVPPSQVQPASSGAKKRTKKKEASATKADVEYDLEENTAGEFSLAALFYASQWLEVLCFSTEAVKDFRDGKGTLVAMSLTINMTIDSLRQTEDEIRSAFHPEMTCQEVSDGLLSCFCGPINAFGETFNDPYIEPIAKLLKGLLQEFEKKMPEIQELSHPGFTLGVGLHELKYSNPSLIDRLSNIMLSAILLLKTNGRIPMAEGSISALQLLFDDRRVEAWMVLAWRLVLVCTVYLPEEIGTASRILCLESERALKQIREHLRFDWGRICCGYSDARTMCADVVTLIATYVLNDPVSKAKDKCFGMKKDREQSHFLHSHPMLCGTLTFGILFAQQQSARISSNDRHLLLDMMHLYNAAKQLDLTSAWPDLEHLIAFYGNQNIFLGSPPTLAENFYKRLDMVHGGKLRDWAPDAIHRHNGRINRSAEVKDLEDPGKLKFVVHRWCIAAGAGFEANLGSTQVLSVKTFVSIAGGSTSHWDPGTSNWVYNIFHAFHDEYVAMDNDLHFDMLAMVRKGVGLLTKIQGDLTAIDDSHFHWPIPWTSPRSAQHPRDLKIEFISNLARLILYADNGHAYAKGRKNKNCKDSSWCRRGIHCLKHAGVRFQELIDEQGDKELKDADVVIEEVKALILSGKDVCNY
ncbi:hypothetical protein NA57DRAFT_76028 [Rhizodiscina lignyota]|uniref:DUF6604 domain-containing protein n=1 Tax=Rhizodiscina lignyota TaxID=1504668 RepID=A0A9P4IDE9_9PEZI|nr:hypothetical protein NA57DRAFT_76028 [Rhizodiscina lignyota]